jgi:hypothetical protein
MPGIAMPEDSAGAMAARILALEKQVQTLLTATRLQTATIDEPGSLQVRDANGAVRLYAGMLGGPGQIGFELVRADGSLAFTFSGLSGDPTFHEVVQLYDRVGNFLVGDDEITGQGLSRPYLPLPWNPTANAYQQLVSTVYANVYDVNFSKQHARAEIVVASYCDPGATGDVDLYDGGTLNRVAGPFALTNVPTVFTLAGNVSGAHLASKTLNVRTRRTSGTGPISTVLLSAYGRS